MLDTKTSQKILNKLTKNSDAFSDIFVENSCRTNIKIENKQVKECTTGVDQGAGLRVLDGSHTTYCYTNDIRQESLLDLASQIQNQSSDKNIHLKKQEPNVRFPVKKNTNSVSANNKIQLLQNLSALAWEQDPRVQQVTVNYQEGVFQKQVFHSLGEHTQDNQNLIFVFMTVTVRDKGKVFSAYDIVGGHGGMELLDKKYLHKTVHAVVNRALLNFEATQITGGPMTVVLASSAGGTIIHEAVGHSLEGDLVAEGMSVFKGKMGQKVANPIVSVVDDATLAQKRGSYSFDDEGVPSQKTTLIENGVLTNYLCDRLAAKKLGLKPTGNGRRESYEYHPITRMSNIMLSPGTSEPSDILASVKSGLYVTKMGGGQVNTVNGDFVFKTQEAFLIKNGKLGQPVNNLTLSGNGPEMIKKIEMIGNDLNFAPSTCGKFGQYAPVTSAIPTTLVKELLVGGLAS